MSAATVACWAGFAVLCISSFSRRLTRLYIISVFMLDAIPVILLIVALAEAASPALASPDTPYHLLLRLCPVLYLLLAANAIQTASLLRDVRSLPASVCLFTLGFVLMAVAALFWVPVALTGVTPQGHWTAPLWSLGLLAVGAGGVARARATVRVLMVPSVEREGRAHALAPTAAVLIMIVLLPGSHGAGWQYRRTVMAPTVAPPNRKEPVPELSRGRRPLVLAVCCLSLFIVGLDITIVNVALPSIQRNLHASVSGLQWTVDAYTLVLASFLMLAGSTGDRIGRRRTFQVGLAVFTTGSLLCGLAPSLGWLIAFRALQAVGGSMLNPVALSIIANTYTDPGDRARAFGIWGAVFGISLAVGPVLGGALVATVGWRGIFWANIPVGIAAIILTALPTASPRSRLARPDRPGRAALGTGEARRSLMATGLDGR